MTPYFKNYQNNEFRAARLYTEACDNVFKKYQAPLRDIYKKYSGLEVLPNEEMNMSMTEFINMVTATRVVDDNFGAREIGIIYNLSMMTQVDEINRGRHIKMNFTEFMEAIARVADRVITPSMYYGGTSQVIQENEEGQLTSRTTSTIGYDIPLDQRI